ncbi:eukaryotic release factor 1 (eRF1) family protein [Actinidia rufa]|uniref:Eukaryotic release factor 1 (ERF1) family protein n=1 Tax=Actinidia rufa TaxID=165716 RepID=A0A7J0G581_9ERIC|nr:eukaryotic release factor 1 (eRF1) family protein [Actinidia rufa]
MKIVRRDYVRNGPGSVKMVAVESEDLWLAYNLIAEGDSVLAVTVRLAWRDVTSFMSSQAVKSSVLRVQNQMDYALASEGVITYKLLGVGVAQGRVRHVFMPLCA